MWLTNYLISCIKRPVIVTSLVVGLLVLSLSGYGIHRCSYNQALKNFKKNRKNIRKNLTEQDKRIINSNIEAKRALREQNKIYKEEVQNGKKRQKQSKEDKEKQNKQRQEEIDKWKNRLYLELR